MTRETARCLGPPGLLPLEDHDDIGECVYCCYRSSYPDLIRTVLKDQPGIVVRRCVDLPACLRRRRSVA